jgi:hypothetical protein
MHLGGGPTILHDLYLVEEPEFSPEITTFSWNQEYVTITASLGITPGDIFDLWIFLGDETVSRDNFSTALNTRAFPAHLYEIWTTEEGEKMVEFTMPVDLNSTQTHMVIYGHSWASLEVFSPASNVVQIR